MEAIPLIMAKQALAPPEPTDFSEAATGLVERLSTIELDLWLFEMSLSEKKSILRTLENPEFSKAVMELCCLYDVNMFDFFDELRYRLREELACSSFWGDQLATLNARLSLLQV